MDALAWYDMGKSRDVIPTAPIRTQGQAGHAHLYYEDEDRGLHFEWDGIFGESVMVSHDDGDDCDVKWVFSIEDYVPTRPNPIRRGSLRTQYIPRLDLPPVPPTNPFLQATKLFQDACRLWIEAQETAEDEPQKSDDSNVQVYSRVLPKVSNHDGIVIKDYDTAVHVKERLNDTLRDFGSVTMADLYDLLGVVSNFNDRKWGWTSSIETLPKAVEGGYRLDLPRPQPLR